MLRVLLDNMQQNKFLLHQLHRFLNPVQRLLQRHVHHLHQRLQHKKEPVLHIDQRLHHFLEVHLKLWELREYFLLHQAYMMDQLLVHIDQHHHHLNRQLLPLHWLVVHLFPHLLKCK
jgi:hypothetical protein